MNDKITPRQKECVRLLVEGKNQKEAAEIIGICDDTITRWKQKEYFTDYIKEEQKKKFDRMAITAQRELEKLLTGAKNEQVKLNAIKDVLDRSGWKPTDKQEIDMDADLSLQIDYGDDK